jgi:polygalacturonase
VVKSGWNSFGRNFGRTSENILVRNINVKYTNGLDIGSEMSGGARNVTFRDSTISDAWHALLLKTELGRGGKMAVV